MFGTILISVITLMHIYVFVRAASVPFVKAHIPNKALIGAGLSLWAVFYFGRVFGHGGTGTLAKLLELAGMNWMGVVFLISICLLAMDLVTVFGLFLPRLAPLLRGYALAAGITLSVIALVQGMRPPVVENYDIFLADLPYEMENTIITAISDLHLGSQLGESWLKALIAKIQDQRPDLIVLLGDIFEGHGQSLDNMLSIMDHLSAPLGVWAVYGNHEFHYRNKKDTSAFEKAGLHVLNNRWTELSPGLILAGVDDLTVIRRRFGAGKDVITESLSGRPAGATILLSHTPCETETAAKAGVGLMLSGHTHGGQIWPFDYFVKRRYPLLEGRYEVDDMTLIVCRGTGTWGPRMRLWRPGVILRLTLHRKGMSGKGVRL